MWKFGSWANAFNPETRKMHDRYNLIFEMLFIHVPSMLLLKTDLNTNIRIEIKLCCEYKVNTAEILLNVIG